MLISSAARREEVGGLLRSEYDPETRTITIDGERTKNGRSHSIPLSPLAAAILEDQLQRSTGEFVFGQREGSGFSGWSKSKTELDARLAEAGATLAPWRIHDLRRSAATRIAELGIAPPHIIESILGHAGHQSGIHGVYNRASYGELKAVALRKWSDHIEKITSGKQQPNVVELPRKRRQ